MGNELGGVIGKVLSTKMGEFHVNSEEMGNYFLMAFS